MTMHKLAITLFFIYGTIGCMQHEPELQKLELQIAELEKQISMRNETDCEAAAVMGCASLGGIMQATGYSPCIPYTASSLLIITAFARGLRPTHSNFHAITTNELAAERRRLLAEKTTLITIMSQAPLPQSCFENPVVITSCAKTLRKRTAKHEEV